MKKKSDYNDFPLYVFHQGKNFKAQEFLGAHKVEDGKYVFRVWAPNAENIYVTGTFNGWSEDASPMYRLNEGGVWETYVEGVKNYDSYKFVIYTKTGRKPTLMQFTQKPVPERLQKYLRVIINGTIVPG